MRNFQNNLKLYKEIKQQTVNKLFLLIFFLEINAINYLKEKETKHTSLDIC